MRKETEKKLTEKAKKVMDKVNPRIVDLDEVDGLKLHNMVLGEKNEALRRQLADRDFADRRKAFYDSITAKYGIDGDKFDIEINPATNQISVTKK